MPDRWDECVFNRMFRIGDGDLLPADVLDSLAGRDFGDHEEEWTVEVIDKTVDAQRQNPVAPPDRREIWTVEKVPGDARLASIWCIEFLWKDHASGIHTPLRAYVDERKTSGILDRIEHGRLALLKRLDRLREHLATPTDG